MGFIVYNPIWSTPVPKVYGTCKCLFIPLNRLRIQVLCHLLDTRGPVTRFLPWKNVPLVSQLRRLQIWFFYTESVGYYRNLHTQNSVLIPSLPDSFEIVRGLSQSSEHWSEKWCQSKLWKLTLKCTQQNHAYLAYICTHPLKPSRNRHDGLEKCE